MLRLELAVDRDRDTIQELRIPSGLRRAVLKVCEKARKNEASKNEQESGAGERETAGKFKNGKKYRCEPLHHDSESREVIGSGKIRKLPEFRREILEQEIEAAQEGEGHTIQFANKVLEEHEARMHQSMHKRLDWRADDMDVALARGDKQGCMRIFAKAIEEGVSEFLGNEGNSKEYSGRSGDTVSRSQLVAGKGHKKIDDVDLGRLDRETNKILLQYRRAATIKGLRKALERLPTQDDSAGTRRREQIVNTVAAFEREAQGHEWQDGMVDKLKWGTSEDVDGVRKHLDDILQAIVAGEKKTHRERVRKTFQCTGHQTAVARKLRVDYTPPLSALHRDGGSDLAGPRGTITSDPKEMDLILQRVWKPIMQGNLARTR